MGLPLRKMGKVKELAVATEEICRHDEVLCIMHSACLRFSCSS